VGVVELSPGAGWRGGPTEPPTVARARAPPQVPRWPGALDPPDDLDAYAPPRVGGRSSSRFLRARARGQPPARPLPRSHSALVGTVEDSV